MELKNIIKRVWTKDLEGANKTVFDLFEWENRSVKLADYKTGEILTDLSDLEFPKGYSQNAVDIIVSKYFRKAGVPSTGHETSMRQVAHRMSDFWVASMLDEDLVKEDEARILYDEIVYSLLSQMWAPNSPQWFNTGLKRAYGITGSGAGNFYWDKKKGEVVTAEDDYTRTQASACFIVSVEDRLIGDHSITDQLTTETRLFKGGSGTGSNFSALRGKGEKLNGGGQSSGLMSFLEVFDKNAGAIKSGGTTRRSAKMVCLDLDHPEIEEFITWKSKEEDKAWALTKMGYDGDINGEAYATVGGQNSNNSLRIPNSFMEAVESLDTNPDAEIELKGRVDSSINKKIRVKDLWEKMNFASWRCADPAPQFNDTFNAWHTSPAGEDGQLWAPHNRLNSTNPCGEYAFLDNTSCNLASINILSFYKNGSFHFGDYEHLVGLVQLVLEASIHWGQFPTKDIARRTEVFRTTGLGMANLGSLLMVMGLPYDSDEARQLAAGLMSLMTGHSYYVSALMAKEIGAFSAYELNKEYMLRVIHNHAVASGMPNGKYKDLSYEPYKLDHNGLPGELSYLIDQNWDNALEAGKKYGYRNAQTTVIAPTGTISFAMDCDSTSIEPFFSHIAYKKLVGGGYMVIANPLIEQALENLGYAKKQIEDILEYVGKKDDKGMVIDGKIEGAPHLKEEHLPIFDTANIAGSGKRYISPEGHVRMVAALQPFVSGAISKTVNLPNSATVEDFKRVHLDAWKMGVKGITLYRDGSKNAQPLNNKLEENKGGMGLESLNYYDLLKTANEYAEIAMQGCEVQFVERPVPAKRVKPAGIRNGTTHSAQIDNVKIYTTVNKDEDGKINEVYITSDREGSTIMGLLGSLSKTISVMLQYQIPAEQISKMLRGQRYEPHGFVQRHPNIKNASSVSDLVSKIIDIELGDYSRVQVKPEVVIPNKAAASLTVGGNTIVSDKKELSPDTISHEPEMFIHEDAKAAAESGERVHGYECSNCSSPRLVQNGTCHVCLDCGTTTGCS